MFYIHYLFYTKYLGFSFFILKNFDFIANLENIIVRIRSIFEINKSIDIQMLNTHFILLLA